MTSTTEDLAKWAKALYKGNVFASSLLPQMLDSVPAKLGPNTKYGIGVTLSAKRLSARTTVTVASFLAISPR